MIYRDEPGNAARGFRMSDARRPRLYALASAREFAAIAAFRGLSLPPIPLASASLRS
jgi:hypothetical protein